VSGATADLEASSDSYGFLKDRISSALHAGLRRSHLDPLTFVARTPLWISPGERTSCLATLGPATPVAKVTRRHFAAQLHGQPAYDG